MKHPSQGLPKALCKVACLVGVMSLLLPSSVSAQTVLADSELEFSDIQGQDDWTYGYRNITLDGGPIDTYDPVADFILFADLEFNGGNNRWDLGGGAPWTEVGATAVHPNGTNNGDEHWAIRRWTAPASDLAEPTLLEVSWFVAAVNANGQGVTGHLHLNGELQDSSPIAGNDTTGIRKSTYLTVEAGDIIDLACSPVGLNGNTADGADGSATSMIITTVVDADGDGLSDSWEEIYFPGDLTQLESGGDHDSDGLLDEEEFAAGTDPSKADTDDDGYTDQEELDAGTNPASADSMPVDLALADSRSQFSDVQGQDGWTWGYRNYTTTGQTTDYDPVADFTPFLIDGTGVITPDVNHWNSANSTYRLVPSNAPWTFLSAEGNHPNGTNSAPNDEHWTIRRWTASDLGDTTPVRVIWHTRKTNGNNDGVTGSLHVNGEEVDTQTIAGNDTTGFIRTYYINLNDDDILDLVLTPQGVSNRGDGSDGSANWMWIDDRIPSPALQPDGSVFIPAGSGDSDGDGLLDVWEEAYFPGDLTQLESGADFDNDGSLDEEEEAAGTDPTDSDTDDDGLTDGEEATEGTDPREADTDGDGLDDGSEVNGDPATDPTKEDTDDDGFSDSAELAEGTDPNDPEDNILVYVLGDSFLQFSGEQGEGGWTWGYRNVTQDGGGTDYDPIADFIPFLNDGSNAPETDPEELNHWNGNAFDFENNVPWTFIAREGTHPNGTNNGDEHWTVRRYTVSGLDEEAAVAVIWHTRKTNLNGNGVTGSIHHNGVEVDTVTIAGNDGAGFERTYYLNVSNGDVVDQILSPVGVDGTNDGSDGSANWMRIDTRIPAGATQPDGTVFIPNNAPDTDEDGLADMWEEFYFPGDLEQLMSGGDFDNDGLLDEEELAAGTDPTQADSDGDGLNDSGELDAGTNPADPDTDGDGYSDFHEVATGFDPLDDFSNVEENFTAIADSVFDFPFTSEPQGEFGWTYGSYNITEDGEPPVNTNFIEFPTDGTGIPSPANAWDGTSFDFFDDAGAPVNPPWTQVGLETGHPNGDNNGAIHWAVRRWTVDIPEATTLALHYHVRADNPNGTGTTAVLLHNGQQVDSITIAGNDTVGLKSWYFIAAEPGDHVEVALSPLGTDGLNGDGADGSYFWLLVDPTIPENPLQPNGLPFGFEPSTAELIDVAYDPGADSVTLTWASEAGKEYQVVVTDDPSQPKSAWTPIGPTFSADASGVNEETIPDLGLGASTQIFGVLEVEP